MCRQRLHKGQRQGDENAWCDCARNKRERASRGRRLFAYISRSSSFDRYWAHDGHDERPGQAGSLGARRRSRFHRPVTPPGRRVTDWPPEHPVPAAIEDCLAAYRLLPRRRADCTSIRPLNTSAANATVRRVRSVRSRSGRSLIGARRGSGWRRPAPGRVVPVSSDDRSAGG